MDPLGIREYLAMGKLVGILCAVAIICFQSSQIHKWHLQNDGNAAKAAVLQSKLDELASQSAQQQQGTEKVVNHYITVEKPGLIREREKIIHAPLPGNCKTPQEVLNADI